MNLIENTKLIHDSYFCNIPGIKIEVHYRITQYIIIYDGHILRSGKQ